MVGLLRKSLDTLTWGVNSIIYLRYVPYMLRLINCCNSCCCAGREFFSFVFGVKARVGFLASIESTLIRTMPMVIQAINTISGTVLIGPGTKQVLEQ